MLKSVIKLRESSTELHLLERICALSKLKARLRVAWSTIKHTTTLPLEFL